MNKKTETFKSFEGIIAKIDRYHPKNVREALYSVLEKFTTLLF
jgi:hypothetical protein